MSTPQPPEPARLWRRLAAIFYDTLLVTALLLVLTALVVGARAGAGVNPGSVWLQVLLLLAMWLYFGWCWTHGGQTLGMRSWRLRLVAAGSHPAANVGWTRATLRFVGAWLSALPLAAGFWSCLFDSEQRCWHDRLSRTRLVHEPRRHGPSAPAAAESG